MHDELSPVSFPVSVKVLPSRGLPVRIDADARARARLAQVHGLESVESFVADLLVTRWKKDGVRVAGTVAAEIVQLCVVTLEPITNKVEAEIDAILLPENSRLARPRTVEGEIIIDAEGADLPDTFEGGEIDAGAIAEEHFELAVDPYPRKPGAALPDASGEDEPGRENPFAKLAALRKDDGK
ncbi:MAG: DUF177 domain-containing protein [Notoacmeibacter sp.]|nr:DUF177 domain-containing protein [Notoacmeibacter sp.]